MRVYFSWLLASLTFLLNAQIPTPDHVVIVVFENRSYYDIIEDPNWVPPYINSLAKDATYGALFSQFYAETHPSQPNYLHLFSGSNQGVTEDDTPTGTPFNTSNLAANLIQGGRTFIGYAEDMPYPGFLEDSTTNPVSHLGLYARKHCPWINWQGNGPNGVDSLLSRPFTDFPSDYTNLPTVSFVIPNMDHDMHNLGRTVADNWLQANLDGYAQWAKSHNSLLIITWDEDDDTPVNHITTIFFGPMVKPGIYDEAPNGVTHHNLLRTIEDMYGLAHSGNAANVSPITDCWQAVLPIQLIEFNAKGNSEGVKLSWSTASEINNNFFTIENSINGLDFKEVANVKGAGTTNEKHGYEYLHENPFVGRSFYRLRQTDLDGRSTRSEVVSSFFEAPNAPSVVAYPNPSDGHTVNLRIRNFEKEDLMISICDLLGQTVESQLVAIADSKDVTMQLTVARPLASGIYQFTVSGGRNTVVQKIIIR